MTERFSLEYIGFVSNSKAIQALWRKRGPQKGDWFTDQGGSGIWLVTTPWPDDPTRWDWIIWLPTLDDLVEGLEKAAPQEYIDLHYDILPPRPDKYWAWQGQPLMMGKRGRGDSWKLAAARLLERLLEESDGH